MSNFKRKGKFMNCVHCNKSVYVMKSRYETFQFCSRSCLYKHKTTKEFSTIECKICKNNFVIPKLREKTAKYCGRKCYSIALKNIGSIIVKCKHCEKNFKTSPSKKRIYCSRQCINKENKKTFKPSFVCVRNAMIRRGMVEKCEKCGYNEFKKILGIHHKDRNRKNNNLDNLQVLCPNCHSIEHMQHIPHGFTE